MSDIKCKKDSDCKSNICEKTYKGRRCVINNLNLNNKTDRQIQKEKKYIGTELICENDSDCPSQLCNPKKINNKIVKVCEKKSLKFEKSLNNSQNCLTNSDCFSNNCKKPEMKCVKIDKDQKDKYKKTGVLPARAVHNASMEGGLITKIILIVMDIILWIIEKHINFMVYLAKIIFVYMSYLLSYIFFWISAPSDSLSSNKCKTNKNYTISSKSIKKILSILIPPYGVFLHLGLSGINEIIISSILTMCFYLPGLFYSLNIINNEKTGENRKQSLKKDGGLIFNILTNTKYSEVAHMEFWSLVVCLILLKILEIVIESKK